MRSITLFLVLACLAVAAAGGEALGSADGALRLLRGAAPGEATLVTADGALELELPAGFHPTALVALDGGWLLAGHAPDGDGHRLHLVAAEGGAVRPLPPPPGQSGRHRVSPAPLVAGGRLAGVAWLEGDGPRSLAVRVAAREGGGWRAGPWVSDPGPGSQMALAAAPLAGGRWLLVWSAWDGEDDEIHWSSGDGERFSPPRPLHDANRVPDITPALAATAGGALAAWSRYDGNDYRLRLARFAGDGWRELDWRGGRGSLEAGFLERDGASYLLFRTVATDTWELVELAADGAVRRRAAAPASPRERPFVELDGPRPVLAWPDGGRLELEWRRP